VFEPMLLDVDRRPLSWLCCRMLFEVHCGGAAYGPDIRTRTVSCSLVKKFINNAFVVTMGTPRCVVTCAFSRLMTGRLQSHF